MDRVNEVIESTKSKIEIGVRKENDQVFLHTGPHHDDIMLGIFPCIIPQLRVRSNKFHFSILTSGFTAVTDGSIRLSWKKENNTIPKSLLYISSGRGSLLTRTILKTFFL